MKKDRKIKVLDGKKWVIKIFASLGVFIITLLIIFNTIDANENQDTFMLLFLISFAIVIVYWIYSYKTSKKYVSIEEYLKINKNIADGVLRQELSKQGFNENEVEFILTGKSLERFKDNEFAEVSEVSRVNENEVNKLKGGQEVHHCTFWDRTKGILITSWIISFIIGIGTGNFGNAVVFWIPLLIPIWAGKIILQSMGLIQFKDTCSISFCCPYCKTRIWFLFPTLRMTCPNCKGTIGYYNDRVYKITKENEIYFKSEQEKTNDLLEKQIDQYKKTSKSNFSEIKELKELLDMGAITQKEFDEKKKELLK